MVQIKSYFKRDFHKTRLILEQSFRLFSGCVYMKLDPEWDCSGFFIPPLVTLHLRAQCLHHSGTNVKPFRIEFALHFRSGPKLSIQCEILSRNHVNRDRSSFPNETGSLPGQRTRSLVFLWFSAVLLRALYLVRLRSSTSSFGNTFM